jgi:hypothetical protein
MVPSADIQVDELALTVGLLGIGWRNVLCEKNGYVPAGGLYTAVVAVDELLGAGVGVEGACVPVGVGAGAVVLTGAGVSVAPTMRFPIVEAGIPATDDPLHAVATVRKNKAALLTVRRIVMWRGCIGTLFR